MSEGKPTLPRPTVDPQILQVILLDELNGRIEELTEKISASNTNKGPMTRNFPPGTQYQFATIQARSNGRVYHIDNPLPDLLVGLIIQVGNSWFPNTYLEWFVDHEPRRIDYVVGEVHAPKEYERGIPFTEEVEWLAYNNDVAAHVFEVLCDGYFIDKRIYNKVTGG